MFSKEFRYSADFQSKTNQIYIKLFLLKLTCLYYMEIFRTYSKYTALDINKMEYVLKNYMQEQSTEAKRCP